MILEQDIAQQQRILVLQGGPGSERAVSLRSAAQVVLVLREVGHRVTVADPADRDFAIEKLAQPYDVVVLMVHGQCGEDGVLQSKLEAMGKPFLGSGSAACALTYNKADYRSYMAASGVRMALGEVVSRQGFAKSRLRQAPYVLKPVDGGSSFDTVIVRDIAHQPDGDYFDAIFGRHGQMLLEQLIVGQEITVGVLGDRALPVILIEPPTDAEFDYENKYNGATREIVNPPQIALAIQKQAQALALRIHGLTGCRHVSRTDMIVTAEGELYVLETNTLPGMTAESLFPKAALAAGYDMRLLMECFVAMAKGV